jgi:hypothetical protein
MKVERGEHATSGKYLQFLQSVKKAEAEAEQAAVGVIALLTENGAERMELAKA